MKAQFDAALDRAERAEQHVPGVPYSTMLIDSYRGQIAMARGEVALATTCYTRAHATARASFLQDHGSATRCEAFMAS